MADEPELFSMRVLTPKGQQTLWVLEGSDDASNIGHHWNAIKRFRNTGERRDIERFKDVEITGIDPDSPDMENPRVLTLSLASDLDQIRKWAKQGELDEADPYAEVEGGGDA
jgi:soluble cytochrome b562